MTVDQLRKCLANIPGELSVSVALGGDVKWGEEAATMVTHFKKGVMICDGSTRDYPCIAILHEDR